MASPLLLAIVSPIYIVIGALVALLLFGKKLPELGRSLGKGIVEFKKGLSGIEDDFNSPGQPQAPTQTAHVEPPKPPQPLPRAPEFHEAPKSS